MHYYKKNIGDYHKKAGRLTMLQHGAYTLLIDSCYDREQFPTMEEAIDWLWASSKEEIEAVEFVLSKFFTLNDGVFVQNHIEEDLDKYHKNAETNKRIALEREAKRRDKRTKRAQTVNESPPNQEPLTKEPENHKPSTKVNKRFSPPILNDVRDYMMERVNDHSEAEKFIDFYQSKNWMIGKNKMKDWKAAVRNWLRGNKANGASSSQQPDNWDDDNWHKDLGM